MRAMLASAACLFLAAPTLRAADPAVDYARDIKPLLAKNCAGCHGGGKAKGGLRVDTVAAALKGGDSGPAVVPGKSQDSLLFQSLTGGGDAPKMPPRGPGLSKAEVSLVKAWIDAGAKAPANEPAVAAGPADKGGKPGVAGRGEGEREREDGDRGRRMRGKGRDRREKDDD